MGARVSAMPWNSMREPGAPYTLPYPIPQSPHPLLVYDTNVKAIEALTAKVRWPDQWNAQQARVSFILCQLIHPPTTQTNKTQGAQPAASLEKLASQADVLVTMLPATQHVTAVLEGSVLPNAKYAPKTPILVGACLILGPFKAYLVPA